MEVEATSRQVASKMSERIYRDPVHNIIRLRTDTDEGELMMRSLNLMGRVTLISAENRPWKGLGIILGYERDLLDGRAQGDELGFRKGICLHQPLTGGASRPAKLLLKVVMIWLSQIPPNFTSASSLRLAHSGRSHSWQMKSAARTVTNSLHCKAFADAKLKQVRTTLLKAH